MHNPYPYPIPAEPPEDIGAETPLVVIYRSGSSLKKFAWRRVPRTFVFESARAEARSIRAMSYRALVMTEGVWAELGLPDTWEAAEYLGRTIKTEAHFSGW